MLEAVAFEVLHPVGFTGIGVPFLERLRGGIAKNQQAAVLFPEGLERAGGGVVAQGVLCFAEPRLVGVAGNGRDGLERRFAAAVLDQLVAQQPAEHIKAVAVAAKVFRMLFQHRPLEVLHAVELARLSEAFLHKGLRDRIPQDSQRVRRVLPKLPVIIVGSVASFFKVLDLCRRGASLCQTRDRQHCCDQNQHCADGHTTSHEFLLGAAVGP